MSFSLSLERLLVDIIPDPIPRQTRKARPEWAAVLPRYGQQPRAGECTLL